MPAIHAQPRADRQAARPPAVKPLARIPRERRRDGAVAGQAGARHRLLRHRFSAYLHGRGSRERGRRLPLSAIKKRPLYEPAGIRGDGPTAAARYWGLASRNITDAPTSGRSTQRRDLLHPADRGHRGIENLDDILKNVPGIGAVLIGEGDLCQELGYPRQYEHKVVLEWMKRDRRHLQEAQRRGGPSARRSSNVERIVKEGYRFLMCAPVQSYGHLEAARKATGRT